MWQIGRSLTPVTTLNGTTDGRMAVHDRHHVLPLAEDLAVNEPLQIGRRAARHDRIAVEVELQHVLLGDQRRRHAAGQQKPIGSFRMPHADMAEAVDHALIEQDMVGIDQFADRRTIVSDLLSAMVDRRSHR